MNLRDIVSPYRTSSEQAAQWIAGGSSATVALLPESASPRKVGETLAALANAHGGVLVLGVNASGQPAGLSLAAATREQAEAAALMAEPPLVLPLPEIIVLDGLQSWRSATRPTAR